MLNRVGIFDPQKPGSLIGVAILAIFEKKPNPTGDKSARGVVIYKE